MGLREQLYAVAAPPSEDVEIGGVLVRMVGLSAIDQLEMAEMGEGTDATFWVLERMIRDSDNVRVFEDGDPLLRGLELEAVGKLSEVAGRLMGVGEAVKNSEAVQSSEGS